MDERNTVYGDRLLCAWSPAEQVVWVQSRSPKYARKLKERSDSRQVMTGVNGGYLRTFEFRGKTMAWAKELIERYTRNEMRTGTPLNP